LTSCVARIARTCASAGCPHSLFVLLHLSDV
jgi:hypothetical protein